jgi:hypothetical protein
LDDAAGPVVPQHVDFAAGSQQVACSVFEQHSEASSFERVSLG